MIILDNLEDHPQQKTSFQNKTWPNPLPGWKKFHLVHEFAGYGGWDAIWGPLRDTIDNDINKASQFLENGEYAIEYGGVRFTDADYVSVDFEQWPVYDSIIVCPHDGSWVPSNNFNPPYDAIENIDQTAIDVKSQINGQYGFYNYGPQHSKSDTQGNTCWSIDGQEDFLIPSNYQTWDSWPVEDANKQTPEILIKHVKLRAEQSMKYVPNIPRFQNTSLMWIGPVAAGTGEPIPLPTDDWRKICKHIFHYCNGLALWYYLDTQGNGGYQIDWNDAGVQANVDAIREEYDNLWSNVVVGAIAGIPQEPPGISSEARAVFDRMSNLTQTEKDAIEKFVDSQVLSGNWAKMDEFYCFALNNTGNDWLTGWISHSATIVGAASWSSDGVVTGSATLAYLLSGVISDVVTQFQATDGSFGIYCHTMTYAATSTASLTGVDDTIWESRLQNIGGGTTSVRINSATSISDPVPLADMAMSLHSVVRPAANLHQYHINGVVQPTVATGTNAGLPVGLEWPIGSHNVNGLFQNTREMVSTGWFIGAGSIDQLNLYDNLIVLYTELGVSLV